MSHEAISAIRTKAELARRLSGETRDPAAKARLLEIATLLDVDADRLEIAAQSRGNGEECSERPGKQAAESACHGSGLTR